MVRWFALSQRRLMALLTFEVLENEKQSSFNLSNPTLRTTSTLMYEDISWCLWSGIPNSAYDVHALLSWTNPTASWKIQSRLV